MKKMICGLVAAGFLGGLVACGGQRDRGRAAVSPSFRGGLVSGKLTDRNTSQALGQVVVTAQHANRPYVYARTTSNPHGTFTLSKLPLGVPLRVVSQPVTATVAYTAEVSTPFTLSRNQRPQDVNLSFDTVAQPGSVEVTGFRRPGRVTAVALVQKRTAEGHPQARVLLRQARPDANGALRFNSVPPGAFEVHFRTRGRGPQIRGRVVAITVTAGETTRVTPPARQTAVEEGPDEMGPIEGEAAEVL